MVEITLVDGKKLQFEESVSVLGIAKSISEGLARIAIVGKVNNELVDLSTTITNDSTVQIITSKDKESYEILNHTTAHVFAQAVVRLYPKAKITIGPPIENGFWYDVDCEELNDSNLLKVEDEMRKIIKEDLEITKDFKSIDEAKEFFKDNEYKLEIIEGIVNNSLKEDEGQEGSIEGDKLQFYTQGEFSDLCRGPHLMKTGLIKAFKLDKVTKAYWRGNADNKQLNRVYGSAFWKKSEMDEYFAMLEEAKKRDHRMLGKKLKLYTISELVGAGLPLFHPKGTIIRKELEEYLWKLHEVKGYIRVWTPHLAKTDLYKKSGHYEHYKENFRVLGKGGEEFMMKPMNCPHHMQLFADNHFSYKDMPIRYFEPATVYRDELSGTLSGLTRVRCITQDDGHLFCREDQIKEECLVIAEIIKEFYNTMGMKDYWVSLSVRDSENKKDYIGDDTIWEKTENSLKEIVEEMGAKYKRIEGEAAFYGPKLDFMFKDSIGREHQLSTIQLDFAQPDRFDLSYIDENGEKIRPVVIHRVIAGSLERNMGLMIEHFAGKFPLWLSPNQIKIIPVADRHQNYCEDVRKALFDLGFKVEVDTSHEGVGKKIAMDRTQSMSNYVLVLGDENVSNNSISVRTRKFVDGRNEEFTTTLEEFIERITKERESREIYF